MGRQPIKQRFFYAVWCRAYLGQHGKTNFAAAPFSTNNANLLCFMSGHQVKYHLSVIFTGKLMLQRLKQSLQRTRNVFTEGVARLLLGKKQIDADLLDELETLLISADVGMETVRIIMKELTAQISRRSLKDSD